MKKVLKRFSVILLVSFFVANMLMVSAAKYQRDIVVCDFEKAESAFLMPGDYDGNGAIDDNDFIALRSLILSIEKNNYTEVFEKDENSIYSDANGDGLVDIRDLVLQDENKSADLVKDGVMVLNGNSAFGGEVISVLGTGAQYQIKCSYITDSSVAVKLNGIDGLLSDKTVTETNDGVVTVTRDIKTPFTIENQDGIELQIVGEGKITDFSFTRVNMDNEISDKAEW